METVVVGKGATNERIVKLGLILGYNFFEEMIIVYGLCYSTRQPI